MCCCCSLTFSRVVAPKGAVCVFRCLSANLALQEFFQAINFHFTQTTKHQPTRNLHFLHTALCSDVYCQSLHFFPPRAIKYHKIREYSRGKWPTISLFLTTFTANLSAFTKLLICLKFFAYCGFPNNFIDVVSPNSRVKSKFLHV